MSGAGQGPEHHPSRASAAELRSTTFALLCGHSASACRAQCYSMPWYTRDVTLDFSRPGKLTDNAVIEALNGRFRAECLNAHWFMSSEDARQKMEAWRRYYNEERPHDAIGQKAPITLLVHDGTSSPPS